MGYRNENNGAVKKMSIPIELLVFFALIGFTILFFLIITITKIIKLWRYKPENDKGKLAEDARRRLADIQRPAPVERRSILPTSNSGNVRQNSSSPRKPAIRLFRRR